MAVTIKDVAREAGVSIATVSKIINGAPGISEATTRRVEEVMRALDYAPNSRAASLARKSARCVAFLAELDEAAPYTNPHLFDIMCGVQTALFSKGYALTLLDSLSADVEKMILSRAFDGIIVHGGALTRPIASLLIARRFPHIVIGHPSDVRLNWVDTDHTLGGRIACEHLIDCGCERLAFMGEGETAGISNQRLTGFRTALLGRGELPQGIVCGSNLLAYAFTLAAAERGVAIPGDMLLITFDRYPYSGLISPEPTLVQIDVRDMGRAAAKQLLQGLKKPELRVQSYTTLPSLIEGQSTRKL